MMAKLFNKPGGPIGCWHNDHIARLAQLLPASNTQRCVTASAPVAQPLEDDRAEWTAPVTSAIKSCLSRGGFRGQRTVTCLPEPLIRYTRLRLAQMPDDELETAVYWQVAKELSRRTDDLRSAFIDVGTVIANGRTQREVIAIATSLGDVDAHAESLMQAGLEPMAIDVLPAALARCIRGSAAEPSFVIAVDAATTLLMTVCDGRPTFVRSIAGGHRTLMEQARAAMGHQRTDSRLLWSALEYDSQSNDDDDAHRAACTRAMTTACSMSATELAHEVNLCLHHLSTNDAPHALPRTGCVIGAGVYEDTFRQAIEGEMRFEPLAQSLTPTVLESLTSADPDGSIDAWLPAIGLAMYDCERARGRAAA